MAVDVADSQSVDLLASEVRDQFGVLDILINNAAGMSPYGEQALTADLDASRVVFETTLYGSWRMIQAFVPLLRLSSSGRIVNVTSGAGSHGDPYFGLTTNNGMGTSYAVSKAALNALTVKIANELADAKILVNAACPGFTATFEGGESMGARPVREGAAGIVWAAELAEDGPTGKFFRDGQPLAW
jgi:NAD(P)-dependent dehydrogenase (short-subunit alcohol dehydrogenase family)